MVNMAMDTAGNQEAALPEIGFQKIKNKYTVFSKFAIKQNMVKKVVLINAQDDLFIAI